MNPTANTEVILDVRNLHTQLVRGTGPKQETLSLVRGIDFSVRGGQTLALVGESGCGKSLTSLSLMRLLARSQTWSHKGQAWFKDSHGEQVDLLSADENHMRSLRGNEIAMIFQEPMTSLNPVLSIAEQLMEPLRLHKGLDARSARAHALRALDEVEIPDASSRLGQYPHQMSGGMRQRVMIAMAMICEPRLLIADEPTTALDVTIQAQILKLMSRLRRERGMAVLFITHNLGVVAHHADEVAVMYAGQVVESADVRTLFARPTHPYTQALLRCLPGRRAVRKHADELLYAIEGQAPNMAQLGAGCAFAPRCPSAQDPCRHEDARERSLDKHRWRCTVVETVEESGI
jgi:peptide/nickel transport system ATP-binding protein